MATAAEEAYCTLLTSDEYLPGAMVLAHSLRDHGTKKQLAALVTLDTLRATTIEELKTIYDQIIPVGRIVNKSPANLYLMDRLDLHSTFTKIELWRQTQFKRIVYLDADVVALRAPDELFALKSSFSAVPDIGWPDCFNSGVMVLTPNVGDYYALLALSQRGISFDGADQGLLNMHFREWDRLSFTYNCTPSGNYQYVPAYRHFQSGISMVHFIGHEKPWTLGRDSKGRTGVYEELLGRWWAVYERHFRAPTTAYISGQTPQPPNPVQYYVHGEATTADYGYSSIEPVYYDPTQVEVTPGPVEIPFTEHKQIFQGGSTRQTIATRVDISPAPVLHALTPAPAPAPVPASAPAPGPALALASTPVPALGPAPAPARTVSTFVAPKSDWDPIRAPPPTNSRPEAFNFPTQTYDMSVDRNLYQPPKSYPEPPKNMWYEVPPPQVVTERPKPIFPWEENQAKPTRVFIEDQKPPSPELTTSVETDEEALREESEDPVTPPLPTPILEPFASYSRTNAWDDVPEIERYVAALVSKRTGKVQVLHQTPPLGNGEVVSPGAEDGATPRRKPSMKLTDFPTEFERPSLPVTPAPMRRPSFWGEERDAAGELPAAEGVPKQEDWDPLAKLEELSLKQSGVLAQVPTTKPTAREIPLRELPESAVPLPAEKTVLSPQSTRRIANHEEPKSAVPLPSGKTVLSSPPTTVTKSDRYEEPESAALLPTSEETDVPPTSTTGSDLKEMDFGKRDLADAGEDSGVFESTD